MIHLDKIFSNLFSDSKITPKRFRNFCRYVLNALTNSNTDGKYDDDIVKVKAVLEALKKEIGDVSSGLTEQVNNTSELQLFIYNFGQYMKNVAGAIAFALGGKDTAAFREFYPYKAEEYYRATKTNMPDLTNRVAKAGKKYAAQLGDKISTDLQAFEPGWDKVVDEQETQMNTVDTDRKERNSSFTAGQWTLTSVVHSVANINNGNPAASQKLFDFTMLYPQSKPFVVKAEGKLAAKESGVIVNRTLNKRVKIVVVNTSINADALVWLAVSPTEEAPVTATVIGANSKGEIKADELDSLKGTFLMIKNGSDINEVTYSIEITGLKRTKEEKAAEKENMEVVEEEKTA